jgi:NAD+ synthase
LNKDLNPRREINRISGFVRTYVENSGAKGVVLGLSGGIDSAVVAHLSVKALGREHVLGVFLFEDDSKNSRDYYDAKATASLLRIKTIDLQLTPVIGALTKCLRKADRKLSRLTLGNLKSRSRMVLLYAIANQRNLLVVGTGDRSEIELGYFTKYGDGSVDFLPIGHLFKTEVLDIARELGVQSGIISKPSSPRLWRNQKASDELPADYPVLDRILSAVTKGLDRNSFAKKLNLERSLIDEVLARKEKTKHKREMPAQISRSGRGG